MILRRVIEHVRTQNWTAVALDFLIVVVGVFIGLQVQEWSAHRAEQERIRAQLNSFREELILARGEMADVQAYYGDRISSAIELKTRLESDEAFPEADLYRLTVSALRGRALAVRFRAYEEMAMTGVLSKVDDKILRNMIHEWDSRLSTIRTADQGLEDMRISILIPIFMESMVFTNVARADSRYIDIPSAERFQFDLDDIRANRTLDGAIAFRHLQAKQQLGSLTDFIQATENLITALETEAQE